MDEDGKQLIADVREPLPICPGSPAKEDAEYERRGTANLFLAFDPLAGWRRVEVTERKTGVDFAHFVRRLVGEQFADAERVVLVVNAHVKLTRYGSSEVDPPLARPGRFRDNARVGWDGREHHR